MPASAPTSAGFSVVSDGVTGVFAFAVGVLEADMGVLGVVGVLEADGVLATVGVLEADGVLDADGVLAAVGVLDDLGDRFWSPSSFVGASSF